MGTTHNKRHNNNNNKYIQTTGLFAGNAKISWRKRNKIKSRQNEPVHEGLLQIFQETGGGGNGGVQRDGLVRSNGQHFRFGRKRGDARVNSTDKSMRRSLMKIVRRLQGDGSRFLIFDKQSQSWTVVSDKKARNKVAKTIRNNRMNHPMRDDA